MGILKIEDVTYNYKGTKNGVENISFEADGGDLIAVVGRNGAGKTTFLNLLSGVYQPQKGRIICPSDMTYHDLGICTQKQSIDWYLNVYDNIFLGAMLAGLDKDSAHLSTKFVGKMLDLINLFNRDMDSLSGGQQQRVQVARALVHNPVILILDEPTVGLDFCYSQELFGYLQQKSFQEKRLIFVSSHDLSMLEDYCNKILFLDEGKQVYFGDMRKFFNSYNLSREIRITYAGNISEELTRLISEEGVIVDKESSTLYGVNSNNLDKIIICLLREVSITEVDSEKIKLKDIILQKEVELK